MFCTNCGVELKNIDRFCSQCGTPTVLAPEAPRLRYVRVLSRPMDQKKIAGVCAGFARYFDCDVTLMRVIWLIVAFGTGIGFIAYLVAWVAMPKDYSGFAAPVPPPPQPTQQIIQS